MDGFNVGNFKSLFHDAEPQNYLCIGNFIDGTDKQGNKYDDRQRCDDQHGYMLNHQQGRRKPIQIDAVDRVSDSGERRRDGKSDQDEDKF